LNVWRLTLDLRPAPSLKSISDHVRAKHFDEAEAGLRRRLRRSERDAEALIMLASVRAERGDLLGAARLLQRVPVWWANRSDLRALEGRLLLDCGRARDAETAWRQCLEADSLHPPGQKSLVEAALGLLELYTRERRQYDARELVTRTWRRVAIAEREAVLRAGLSAELRPGPSAGDLAPLRRHVAADAGDLHARRALALAEQFYGNPEEAVRQIDECRRQRPDDPLVLRDSLTILLRQGQTGRFLAAAASLPKSTRESAELARLRAIARESQGESAAAAADLRELVKRDPADAESFARLAEIDKQLGLAEESERSREQSRRVTQTRRSMATALDDLSRLGGVTPKERTARQDAVQRIAIGCDQLGWVQEAGAWASLEQPR
jgi:predicted Zn-dependent protease